MQVPIDAGPGVEREVSEKSGPAEHGGTEGSEAEPMNPGEGGNPDTEGGGGHSSEPGHSWRGHCRPDSVGRAP